MTMEQLPYGEFSFTDQERLYDRISDEQFRAILGSDQTSAHDVAPASNDYGEFLFVTLSQMVESERKYITFWGLGFHEQRERWITDEWRWYESSLFRHAISQVLEKEDAVALVDNRRDEIAPNIGPVQQSKRARLFEIIADLTDDDAAQTELEDLGVFDDDNLA